MMPWFRLYPELLKDPKLRRFNTIQKWLWITAMCEAAQSSERGKLFIAEGIDYTDDDLGQAAGLSPAEGEHAKGFINLCVTLKMMERHADGGVTLSNFLDRQYQKPSDQPEATKARKRKEREKKAQSKVEKPLPDKDLPDSHSHSDDSSHDVTPCHALDTDTDSDTDSDTEEKEPLPPIPSTSKKHEPVVVVVGSRDLHVFKSVIDQYKCYFTFDPNPTVIGLLHSYLDDGLQMDLLAWAMRDAAEKGKQWQYAKGTIENLFSGGARTAEQAEIADQAFKLQRGQKQKVIPMVDKLPLSVQRQLQREKEKTELKATSARKTVIDDPELKRLLESMRARQTAK